jgi:transcriptional regulator with XRE-family HTH domain
MTENPLDRVRAELQGLDDADVAKDDSGDALLHRALGHLQSDDLLSISVDLMDGVPTTVQLPSGEEERARERVHRAAALIREQSADAATLLWEAREAAGVSEQEACDALTLSRTALKRVESGRGMGALLNQSPEQVGAYIHRLGIDPRHFLAALFASARTTGGQDQLLLSNSPISRRLPVPYPPTKDSDSKWALAFLQSVETHR